MSRTAIAAAVIAVFAACFGASLARRQELAAPARATPAQGDQQPIDQTTTLPLTAERAPPGCGERALEHVRAIVGFGQRHSGTTPTPGWSQQLDYVAAELQRAGLE